MMIERCRAKGCGQLIKYVKTVNGKNMPCNPRMVWIIPDPSGEDTAFRDFETIRGYIVTESCDGSIGAFLTHFGDCTRPAEFRRERSPSRRATPRRRQPIKSGEIAGVQRGFDQPEPEHEQLGMFPPELESPKDMHIRMTAYENEAARVGRKPWEGYTARTL